MVAAVPFVLLVAALLAFLLSTRQFRWWVRLPIWAIGTSSLICACSLALSRGDHFGLIRLLDDLLRYGPDSLLAEAVAENWTNIVPALLPMLDVLLVLAGVFGIVTLIACTPGETVEKLTRPFGILLVGAILGGFLAFSLVAAGLGGHSKIRVYTASFDTRVDVVDGDTFRLGEVSLRLAGIDAPEYHALRANGQPHAKDQFCYNAAGSRYRCGVEARSHLRNLLANSVVKCGVPSWLEEEAAAEALNLGLREAFGRPIVQCFAHRQDEPPKDIA